MSATPIPRTLTMVIYGDMDISILDQKPSDRRPIITTVIPIHKEQELLESMHKILAKKEKIYWICPLIDTNVEEEAKQQYFLKAAISRYHELQAIFGNKVGLIHGKMANLEKNDMMHDFAHGDLQILVATTVIEVGIDVKEATLIVIEHAERFGLAQLHQLRGRVGRGDKQSYCILLYHHINDEAKARLKIIRSTCDGFKIAEEDLKLRGAGDLLGTKQSGIKDFRFVDLILHQDLMLTTKILCDQILANDLILEDPKHQPLKYLLRLFGYHHCLKYLKSA